MTDILFMVTSAPLETVDLSLSTPSHSEGARTALADGLQCEFSFYRLQVRMSTLTRTDNNHGEFCRQRTDTLSHAKLYL